MPARELNLEVYDSVEKINSNDESFKEIQKKIKDFYLENFDYYDMIEKGTDSDDNPVYEKDVVKLCIGKDLRLRNELNKYLQTNKSKMTSVEYQSVVKSYESLKKKIGEEVKNYDFINNKNADEVKTSGDELYFAAYRLTLLNELTEPKETLTAKDFARNMSASFYIGSLEREYNAAEKILKNGTDEEKEEALKWKNDVVKKLYSGTFDEDLDTFIEENEVGKAVYDYYSHHFNAQIHSEGIGFSQLGYEEGVLSASINTIITKKRQEIFGLKTIEGNYPDGEEVSKEMAEANKKRALELVADIEYVKDVFNLGALNSKNHVEMDTYTIKVIKELHGNYNDKLADIKQRLEDDYNRQIDAEYNKALSEYDEKIAEKENEWKKADSEYHDANKAFEAQKTVFERAKTNYEKMNAISFIDEDDRVANEGVFKREEDLFKKADERKGEAVTKASILSQELEVLRNRRENIKGELELQYKEKKDKNPFAKKQLLKIKERGLVKTVERQTPYGTIADDEAVEPEKIRLNRLSDFLKCQATGKVTADEFKDFLSAEKENYDMLKEVQKPAPVIKTVVVGVEPGELALEERNRQLENQNNAELNRDNAVNQNNIDVNAPNQHIQPVVGQNAANQQAGDEADMDFPKRSNSFNFGHENTINDVSLDINMDEVLVNDELKRPNEQVDKNLPTYEETHSNLTSYSLLTGMLKSADKGVYNGSDEYDDIYETLKTIGELEEYQNKHKEEFVKADLNERRKTLYEAKKVLAVKMKYYINRKNDEKEAAEAKGGSERTNSKRRREAMGDVLGVLKEHIAADEKTFGLEDKDKTIENAFLEINHLSINNKKEKGLKDLAEKVLPFDSKELDEMTADRRMDITMEAINSILLILKDLPAKKAGLSKPLKTICKDLSEALLKDVTLYRPDQLEKIKSTMRLNNNSLKLGVNLDVKPEKEKFNSYDDVKAYYQKLIDNYSKRIFKAEAEKKNNYEEYAIYDEVDGERAYSPEFSKEEKADEKKMVGAALRSIYADVQHKNNIIFDPKTFGTKCDEFVHQMLEYKSFNAKLAKKLTTGFNLTDKDLNTYTFKDIDLSLDKINQIKSEVFKETLMGEIGKLSESVNDYKGKETIEAGVKGIDNLEKLSKMIGTEEIYSSKVKVNGKDITLRELAKTAKEKAGKAVEQTKPASKKRVNNNAERARSNTIKK